MSNTSFSSSTRSRLLIDLALGHSEARESLLYDEAFSVIRHFVRPAGALWLPGASRWPPQRELTKRA